PPPPVPNPPRQRRHPPPPPPATGQRRVHPAPPPAQHRLQTQIRQRRHRLRRAQQRVGHLKQRVRPPGQTPIPARPKLHQPIKIRAPFYPCRPDLSHNGSHGHRPYHTRSWTITNDRQETATRTAETPNTAKYPTPGPATTDK